MRILILLACLCAGTLGAAVKPGENIIVNGRFEADQTDVPPYWTLPVGSGVGETLFFRPSGGPKGIPCVRMCGQEDGSASKGVTFRQYGLSLAPGGRYRLSAMVRTEGLKAKAATVLVGNQGWRQSAGLDALPADSDWTLRTKEFTMFESGDGQYFLAVRTANLQGTVEIADVKLEALDEKALAGTRPSAAWANAKKVRLVPWSPRLHEIAAERRELTFRTFGELPKGSVAVLAVDGKESRRTIEGELVTLPLPEGAKDEGFLDVRVVGPADGSSLMEDRHHYAVRANLPQKTTGRRLNNFVIEIANTRAEEGKVLRFKLAYDGWVYAAVREGTARLLLDGREVVTAETARGETFRRLAAGPHTVALAGGSARVVVRSIAATFNYPACVSSPIRQMTPYDWDFFRKYVEPAVCVQNGGQIPADKLAEFRARGGYWLANLTTSRLKDDDDLFNRLQTAQGLSNPAYDGVTCDEQGFGSPVDIERYLVGLKKFNARYEGDRDVFTWIVGKPAAAGTDHEFIASTVNGSRGHAMLMYEIYCRTKENEEIAKSYIRDYMVDAVKRTNAWYPDAARSVGVALGNFTQVPLISLVHHPEVDYKYYLDLQLNIAANDPEMKGLGCIGYWGSYYGDEEMYRWSMALLRHYAVEGRTEMLSERYGYRYRPGLLANGDFRGSLEGWSVAGEAKTDRIRNFGATAERRWGSADELGDTFAVLAPGASVSQVVKGLVPGRRYTLQLVGFDAEKARAKDPSFAGELPFEVRLGAAAERDAKLSWVYSDRRKNRKRDDCARVTVHHVVFTARASELALTLASTAKDPAFRLGVNGVCLNPYFE